MGVDAGYQVVERHAGGGTDRLVDQRRAARAVLPPQRGPYGTAGPCQSLVNEMYRRAGGMKEVAERLVRLGHVTEIWASANRGHAAAVQIP